MFNYDDFPVLASSMGHGSQETQVFLIFKYFLLIFLQKSTSSTNVNNNLAMKKWARENGPTSSEALENAGMKIHPDGIFLLLIKRKNFFFPIFPLK